MAEDVSNKTIVVLVVLTVLVSLLSTLVVINEVANLKVGEHQEVSASTTTPQGQISLEIRPNQNAQSTGQVVFAIKPRV